MKFNKVLSLALAAGLALSLPACTPNNEESSQVRVNTYSVSVATAENGTVSTNKTTVEEGSSVTLSVKPATNYVLDSLKVNGKEVAVTKNVVTLCDVRENLNVTAVFSYAVVSVSFDTGTDETLESINVTRGAVYGVLPTPASPVGKMFAGWETEEGESVSSSTYVTASAAHTLKATFKTLDEAEAAKLAPYSMTVCYYDQMALSLGVSFHTGIEPYDSVVQVCEGDTFDVSTAKSVPATYSYWQGEYVSQASVEFLEFDKTYTYRMGDIAMGVWSEPITMKTREDKASSSFIYVADTQQTVNNANTGIPEVDWARVMKDAMARFDFDYVVHGGDLVNYGADPLYWKEMLGDVAPYLGQYPLIFASGNHEANDYYAYNVPKLFQSMFNVNYPEQSGVENGAYYSLDIGALHFVVLRSNDMYVTSDKTMTQAQLDWLAEDAAKDDLNEDTKWRVVLMHESVVKPSTQTPNSNNHSGANRQKVFKLLRDCKVDVLLFAHDHYHCTSYPLDYTEELVDLDNDGYNDYTATVTKDYESVAVDGDTVASYSVANGYTSGEDGTIFHEVGSGGRQYNTTFPISNMNTYMSGWRGEYWQKLASNGAGYLFSGDSKAYSLYDYVEVTENTFTLRTYGVHYDTQYDYVSVDGARSKFVSGFRLVK